MKESDLKRLKRNIDYEVSLIDTVMVELNNTINLYKELNNQAATTVEKGGVSTLLMNFYNGIENILKQVSKIYYKSFPRGEAWHKILLKQAWSPPNKKIAVFSEEIADRIYEYLTFRHLFFHGYGFRLEWDKIFVLANKAPLLWNDIKNSIENFLDEIGKL